MVYLLAFLHRTSALPVLREIGSLVAVGSDNRDLPMPGILPLLALTIYSDALAALLCHSWKRPPTLTFINISWGRLQTEPFPLPACS